jgi:hypothetical protein
MRLAPTASAPSRVAKSVSRSSGKSVLASSSARVTALA